MQIKQGNNTTLCGRIAKEPEFKTITKNDKTFSLLKLAVVIGETSTEHKAIWANVDVWGKLADKNRYLKKGDYIHVDGIIEKREYAGQTQESVKAQFIISDSTSLTPNLENETFETLEPLDVEENDMPF